MALLEKTTTGGPPMKGGTVSTADALRADAFVIFFVVVEDLELLELGVAGSAA